MSEVCDADASPHDENGLPVPAGGQGPSWGNGELPPGETGGSLRGKRGAARRQKGEGREVLHLLILSRLPLKITLMPTWPAYPLRYQHKRMSNQRGGGREGQRLHQDRNTTS